MAAACALLVAALATTQGCTTGGNGLPGDYQIAADVSPPAPRTGQPAVVTIQLGKGPDGVPWSGARFEVQAHMTHPGMAPVIAAATEASAGVYTAPITFTMAGDWKLFVVGELPDRRSIKSVIRDQTVPPQDTASP